ncbi:H-NS histone family protein [Stenotrophomonas sp. SY1]|uniref:H-NS histone family protein n=1 Tax=Stenotrophomonas sp. SY1 TaxID=477235 RepID=UPI001E596D53|nr:H-NS histone family protein [Stenotrophomonas sp. SY1]MCD9088314.1 H-NS histone family protein [Stenotrophomonas sp. SY1]
MSIDLTPLNLRELNALIRAAQQQHQALSRRESPDKVRRKLITLARNTGYTIEELFGPAIAPSQPAAKAARRRKGPKVKPKYRDPENRYNTWTGRGKTPLWLANKIRFGHTVADFLIPGVAKLTPKETVLTGKRKLFKQP